MKKLLCLLVCALLTLGACALAEGGQLPLAASLEAYLPSVGHPFTASDEDGDGYNDTFMISFDDGQGTTIEAWCQCFDGIARVVCDMGAVGADADAATICQVVNAAQRQLRFLPLVVRRGSRRGARHAGNLRRRGRRFRRLRLLLHEQHRHGCVLHPSGVFDAGRLRANHRIMIIEDEP